MNECTKGTGSLDQSRGIPSNDVAITPPDDRSEREKRRKYRIAATLFLLGVAGVVLGTLAVMDCLGGVCGGDDLASRLSSGGADAKDRGADATPNPLSPQGYGKSMIDTLRGDLDGADPIATPATTDSTPSNTSGTNSFPTSAPILEPIALSTSNYIFTLTSNPTFIPTSNPTFIPTSNPTLAPTPIRTEFPILTVLPPALLSVTDEDYLRDGLSPQGMAYQWISELDPMAIDLHSNDRKTSEKLVQRYAVAVVGFALVGGAVEERRGLRPQKTERGLLMTVPAERWFSADDECNWTGITCDLFGSVTEIRLARKDLRGTIPFEIGLFKSLTYLDLAENEIWGSIPNELYDCANLEGLFLEHNVLMGGVENGIGKLKNLVRLYLGNNQLGGTLPGRKMDNLRQLSECFSAFHIPARIS